MSMLFLVFFQTISINWIFGGKKFGICIEQMLGKKPSYFLYMSWVFLAPAVMLVCHSCFLAARTSPGMTGITIWVYFPFLGHLHILYRTVHASDIWKQLPVPEMGWDIGFVYLSIFHDVDSRLCSLLYFYDTRLPSRSNYSFCGLFSICCLECV